MGDNIDGPEAIARYTRENKRARNNPYEYVTKLVTILGETMARHDDFRTHQFFEAQMRQAEAESLATAALMEETTTADEDTVGSSSGGDGVENATHTSNPDKTTKAEDPEVKNEQPGRVRHDRGAFLDRIQAQGKAPAAEE